VGRLAEGTKWPQKKRKEKNLTFEGRFFDPFFGDFSIKKKGTGSLGYDL
jgi:hypothetical protein